MKEERIKGNMKSTFKFQGSLDDDNIDQFLWNPKELQNQRRGQKTEQEECQERHEKSFLQKQRDGLVDPAKRSECEWNLKKKKIEMWIFFRRDSLG